MSAPMPDFAPADTPVGTSPDTPPVDSPGINDADQSPQDSGGQADNPAWTPILEKLPDEFHGMIRPELQKWDQTYRSVEQERNELKERYSPFSEIPKENLAAAYQVFQMLETEDGQRQIYEALGQQLGISPAQAQQLVEDQVEESGDDPGDNPWEQQYNGLKTQFEQMQKMFQDMQHEKEVNKQGEIIDSRIQQLIKEDPNLDPVTLLQWADMLHARGARGDLIGQAHAEMKKYNQRVVEQYAQRQQPQRQGPIVMPPTGGNPGSGVDPATRDEQARQEAAAARFQALLNS